MRIEISSENRKWIRADLVDEGKVIMNLYSHSIHPNEGLISAYSSAASYVQFNFPKYARPHVVTDLGVQDGPSGV